VINKAINNKIVLDFKTKLQELLQKDGEVAIHYELIKYEGPPHRRKFYTNVKIDDKLMGEGSGYSKKESEQNAAKQALDMLEGIHE
jgi:ribonuclease-3